MNQIKALRALGIMSGTSAGEVGLSLISTDGIDVYEFIAHSKILYDDVLRDKILYVMGRKPETEKDFAKIIEINTELTQFYCAIVKDFIASHGQIDIIGLETNTIYHNPEERCTIQLGDAQKLAFAVGVKVVANFHKTDVFAGGQGFPLTPVYYASLVNDFAKPTAIMNIGGMTSLTFIGEHGEMRSFDCGPGNLAINEWVQKHAGMAMDYNGRLAITGHIDAKILNCLMKHKYLNIYPPKALSKNMFAEKLEHLEGLSLEDGAATVTAFIAEAAVYSICMYFPDVPKKIIISGGGSKNPTLVRFIKQRIDDSDIETMVEVGMNIDAVENGAAAFWAVRRLNLLPISFPSTTGVVEPMTGGDIFEP